MNDIPDDRFLHTMPHNIEAEQNVLGCVLIEPSTLHTIWRILTEEDFYRGAHREIFRAACYMADKDRPIDLISFSTEIRRRGKLDEIGGMSYITALFDKVPTVANVEYHAKCVREVSQLRSLVTVLHRSLAEASSGSADDIPALVDAIQARFSSIGQSPVKESGLMSAGPVMASVIEDAEAIALARAEGREAFLGLTTGFSAFDAVTGGLQKTDLVIVAARPSMGKTSLALAFAEYAALTAGRRVAIFSQEMSAKQLCIRFACSMLEVDSMAFKSGLLTEEKWLAVKALANRLLSHPLLCISERNEVTPAAMRGMLRKMRHEGGLDLVIVDYLQLCRTERKTGTKAEEVGEIARGLKNIGREFDVPVVALSQLSRAVEQRDNKRPILSDLRESGGIEAEADLVCFLYRGAYYAMKALIEGNPGMGRMHAPQADEEEAELIIGKHRNGPTGTLKLAFVPKYAKFKDVYDPFADGPTGF